MTWMTPDHHPGSSMLDSGVSWSTPKDSFTVSVYRTDLGVLIGSEVRPTRLRRSRQSDARRAQHGRGRLRLSYLFASTQIDPTTVRLVCVEFGLDHTFMVGSGGQDS